MPELAEVEFFRKRWSLGHGAKVLTLRLHEDKKVFRDGQLALLKIPDRRPDGRFGDRGQADVVSLQGRRST